MNVRYHVPPGRYQITATKNGYKIDGQGPWIEVMAGSESTAEVKLKKVGGSD